jgi:hypothetical protein
MFPYLFQADYESGDFAQWTTVTNPGTPPQMAAQHYSVLVQKNVGEVPYRGAYAQHCDLSLGSADAFVASAAIVGGTTGGVRFMVYVGPTLRMGVGDQLTLARIDCGADQTPLMLDNTTGTPRLTFSGAYAAGQTRLVALTLGQWYCIEVASVGTGMQGYVNGVAAGAPLSPVAAPGITGLRLGTMGIDAGTTQGHILFDQVVADDVRVFGLPERYPQIMEVRSSGVVIPGSGRYERVNLIAGHASDNILALYDSDLGTAGPEELLAPLLTSELANREFHVSKRAGYFQYGLKVVMSGTNPQAIIVLGQGLTSAGAIAEWARRRPLMRVA